MLTALLIAAALAAPSAHKTQAAAESWLNGQYDNDVSAYHLSKVKTDGGRFICAYAAHSGESASPHRLLIDAQTQLGWMDFGAEAPFATPVAAHPVSGRLSSMDRPLRLQWERCEQSGIGG